MSEMEVLWWVVRGVGGGGGRVVWEAGGGGGGGGGEQNRAQQCEGQDILRVALIRMHALKVLAFAPSPWVTLLQAPGRAPSCRVPWGWGPRTGNPAEGLRRPRRDVRRQGRWLAVVMTYVA